MSITQDMAYRHSLMMRQRSMASAEPVRNITRVDLYLLLESALKWKRRVLNLPIPVVSQLSQTERKLIGYVPRLDLIADAVSVNSRDYVATYRELTQSLAGVYGEMLLYTSSLEDNARRDWFKISASSIELRGIIAEFLRRLIAYRYAASKAFNDRSTTVPVYIQTTYTYPNLEWIINFCQCLAVQLLQLNVLRL